MDKYEKGTLVFGDWRIAEELGSGSYGTVYRIEKTEYGIKTQSALKVIRVPKSQADVRDVMGDGMDDKSVTSYFHGMVDSLVREIAVMSTLKSHPNIVTYENHKVLPHSGEIGWDILIQMELLTSLRDYQSGHAMIEADVCRLASDMCSALVFCQKKALIHRDIKPQIIFVSEAGQFKLGDFGVARTMDKSAGSLSKQGTEDYMAPEVYRGQKYGPSVDIYSLGLVLYRLMNGGRLPFMPPAPKPIGYGDRLNALSDRIGGEKELVPPCNASPEFAKIILKACAHNPGDRYQTAAEMLEDLTRVNAAPAASEPRKELEREPEETEESGTMGPFGRREAFGEDEEAPGTMGPFRSHPAGEQPPEEPKPEPVPVPAKKSILPKVIAGVAAVGVVAAIVLTVAGGGSKPQQSPEKETTETSVPVVTETQPTVSAEDDTRGQEETTEPQENQSLVTYTDNNGNIYEEYYDENGCLILKKLFTSNGSLLHVEEHVPDDNGEPVISYAESYSYHPDGSVAGWTEWRYNSHGDQTEAYEYASGGTLEAYRIYEYEYADDGTLGRWYRYCYDAEGRLIMENWNYSNLNYLLRTYEYAWFAEGNQNCSKLTVYEYDDDWNELGYWGYTYDKNGGVVEYFEQDTNE